MQESISNFSEENICFFRQDHDIAFLIFIGVFVFLLIGNILNWKWTYEPKSWVGYHWLELLGPTSYRFWHASFAGTHNHHFGSYLFHDLLKRQLLPLKAERCQTLFILINQKKQ